MAPNNIDPVKNVEPKKFKFQKMMTLKNVGNQKKLETTIFFDKKKLTAKHLHPPKILPTKNFDRKIFFDPEKFGHSLIF